MPAGGNPSIAIGAESETTRSSPFIASALVGLGGLFFGVTGPLLSTFIPPLVRDALGDHRTAIGAVMAIDNVLLLLLVPWAGAASDRASASGRRRLPLVLGGYVLAAAGMAVFPWSAAFGIAGVIAAMVVLHTGINVVRSPFQALLADLVPSRYRTFATASVTFQMCVGAIVFLMLGRLLGMQRAFLIAAGTVLAIVVAFAFGLREPPASASRASNATFRSLFDAVSSAVRGAVPGLRAIFIATFLLQLTFQTFTTWYALHGTERFGVQPADVAVGFIAWAIGGVIGALPAGFIGVRIGRRNAMLLGFALMVGSLLALDSVTTIGQATPLLALASAGLTLPGVNAYPLFVEQIPRGHRGVLAAMFLLAMALGGAIGDPLNGGVFDLAGAYRPMFLLMTAYSILAFVTVLVVPRGIGEADTGADSRGVSIRPAGKADAAAILECLRSAFEPYERDYTDDGFADTILTPQTIHDRLEAMSVFVALAGGEVIGTIGSQVVSRDEGHIRGMAVLPAWHGTGVAEQLLAAAEHDLRNRGCSRVTLDTTEYLQRAIRFYEKHGYRPTGRVGDFFGMRLLEYLKPLR